MKEEITFCSPEALAHWMNTVDGKAIVTITPEFGNEEGKGLEDGKPEAD